MEQIIITYNKQTSKITFERIKNVSEEKTQLFNFPSKLPALNAFYVNRKNYLDSLHKKKRTESDNQKYPYQKEIKQQQSRMKWPQISENLISRSQTNQHFHNQESIPEVKKEQKYFLTSSFDNQEKDLKSENSSFFDFNTKSLESNRSQTLHKNISKESVQKSEFEKKSLPELAFSGQTNSNHLPLFKSQPSQVETILQEEQTIWPEIPTFPNEKDFDMKLVGKNFPENLELNKQCLRNNHNNLILNVKVQALSASSQNLLDKTLLKFARNPIFVQLSLVELSHLCIQINLNRDSSLKLSIKSLNSLTKFKSNDQLSNDISIIQEKEPQKQKFMNEAMKILSLFYNLLDELDSFTIIQRFSNLNSSKKTKIQVKNSLQNVSQKIEKSSFGKIDSTFQKINKTPEICRLIDILSLLESLKQTDFQID